MSGVLSTTTNPIELVVHSRLHATDEERASLDDTEN
jgi:hypothetical protein